MARNAKISNKEVPLDKKDVDDSLPEKVKLAAAFGYYDDSNALRYWAEGVEVTDPATVEDLILREAPLIDITYDSSAS